MILHFSVWEDKKKLLQAHLQKCKLTVSTCPDKSINHKKLSDSLKQKQIYKTQEWVKTKNPGKGQS